MGIRHKMMELTAELVLIFVKQLQIPVDGLGNERIG